MFEQDFPILSRKIYGRPLVYLDNAATTQKPRCVVEAMTQEYYNVNANVHRGVHYLSQQATDLHEQAREKVRSYIGAASTDEVLFTRGTTESINLVASCLSRLIQQEGSCPQSQPEVIVSTLEHHSNIVSWQLAGFKLRVIPADQHGALILDQIDNLFSEQTALVAIAHVSNVTGAVNPIESIIRTAHKHGVPVLIDAAQSAPHMAINVQQIDCDFLALSGHKMYGPTGIGVLYGRRSWLHRLPPYMGGGEMIRNVTFEKTTYNDLPYKFEAGTPDYIATTGLARAIDYVQEIGLDNIAQYERQLTLFAYDSLREAFGPDITIYSPLSADRDAAATSVLSFNLRGAHHLDVGTLLDRLGVAVRTGHHCAEPLMRHFGVEGTVRASLALYNTQADITAFIAALQRVAKML